MTRAKKKPHQPTLAEKILMQERIAAALTENPKTVKELADALGRPKHVIAWHLVAMAELGRARVVETRGGGNLPTQVWGPR